MTTAATALSDLGLSIGAGSSTPAKKSQSLGQDDFLKLMTTQLTNQDPLKPLDSQDFLGQIAQFSTVSGIQSLQSSFDSLSSSMTSSQSLQAAGLVGHGVLYPSKTGYLESSGTLTGAVDVPASGDLVVEITDGSGQVVRRLEYGEQASGTTYFNWDGKDGSGTVLPAGSYGIKATVTSNGSTQAASTLAAGVVQSVTLGSNGLTLNLAGLGPVALSSIRQII